MSGARTTGPEAQTLEGDSGTGTNPSRGESDGRPPVVFGDPARAPRDGRARVGMRLGRYELLTVLGHGAMATVFRARDGKLKREVAIKVMGLAFAARPEAAERFRREAQAVAAVKHTGIVEIFDFVPATDDEPAYIVSELIDGPTLRQLIEPRRGRLLPEVAALVVAPIAEALAAAHKRGVVHRDVKPDNVMLERAGAESRVVLADFGIAHVTGLETMTATGALVGSPAYMSPEQARGLDVGPASDVWALGVILYELATGSLPFGGKDPLAVALAIAKGQFKRPSQLSALVSPALERLILACLMAEPASRPAGADEVARTLRLLAREAGVDEGAVRRLLDDADALEVELRPRLADGAAQAARAHIRSRELGKALAEIGRAQALVPGHLEAGRLLASLTAQQRLRRMVKVAGGVAAIAAAAVALGPAALRALSPAAPRGAAGAPSHGGVELHVEARDEAAAPRPAPVAATEGVPPERPLPASVSEPALPRGRAADKAAAVERPARARRPSAASTEAANRAARATPAAPSQEVPAADGSETAVSPAARERDAVVSPAAHNSEAVVSSAPPTGQTDALPRVTPPDLAAVAPPVRVKLRLRSPEFRCQPSLEGRPPRDSFEEMVTPGSYRVFCTRAGQTRTAGTVVVPVDHAPGRALTVTVVWRPDGTAAIERRGGGAAPSSR